MMVMPRPADIALTDCSDADGTQIQGTVTGCLFEGRDWRVTIDVAGETLPPTSPVRTDPGARVGLQFRPDAALLFPAPAGALA